MSKSSWIGITPVGKLISITVSPDSVSIAFSCGLYLYTKWIFFYVLHANQKFTQKCT